MRLIEVARKLGMTGQELRRELSQVDFGVKATDREVPAQLAQGIIRYVARKYNIEVKEDEGDEEGVEEDVKEQKEEKEEREEKEPKEVKKIGRAHV